MPGTGNGDDDGGIHHNLVTAPNPAVIAVLIDGVEVPVPPDDPLYAVITEWATATPLSEQGEPEGE